MTEIHPNGTDEHALQTCVDGGILHGTQWRPDAPGPAVLGLHGVTANHRSFRLLAERVPGEFIAIDLRGRGRSRQLPPPFTLQQLADDSARVLDAAGVERAVVVGHSMGGFVAALLADRHPDRVAALVLVDGGLPLRPPDQPAEDPAAALGPAMERLSMTFSSPAAYRDFWRDHPAIGPWWNETIQEYLDYDLAETPHGLRPTSNPDAVLAAMNQFTDPMTGEALERAAAPATLLRAPRGLLNETPGLYDDTWLAGWQAQLPRLTVRDVTDVNHYTILMGTGVDAVADAVRGATATSTW